MKPPFSRKEGWWGSIDGPLFATYHGDSEGSETHSGSRKEGDNASASYTLERSLVRRRTIRLHRRVLGVQNRPNIGVGGGIHSVASESLERIAQSQPGEVIEVEEAELVGTLRIPAGVSVTGQKDRPLVIRPRDGEPGIILEGEGRSTVSHVRVEEATGVGIHIIGQEVILNDVVVTNTRTGATEEGHGILVEDAPAFTANEVSSNGNAGSGLVASNTD